MPAERTAFHSRHHSRQRKRQFPSSCPPVSASCFLLTPWPSPLSRSHPHSRARRSSATIAAPCAVPARASGRRVRGSTSPPQQSAFSASLPPKSFRIVILPSTRTFVFPVFNKRARNSQVTFYRPNFRTPAGLVQAPRALQGVRQRDTFIPPADIGKLAEPLSFARSLFDSVVSVLPAYGTKIALIPPGNFRPPHLENAY